MDVWRLIWEEFYDAWSRFFPCSWAAGWHVWLHVGELKGSEAGLVGVGNPVRGLYESFCVAYWNATVYTLARNDNT